MNAARIGLLALACTLPLAAVAQWQWLDKDGRKVFSDKSPPPDIPAKNILKQPGAARPAPDAATTSAPVSTEPAWPILREKLTLPSGHSDCEVLTRLSGLGAAHQSWLI